MEKTIEIPEGHEARIEGNKVILERKEIEDERIREQIEQAIIEHDWSATYKVSKDDCLAYLERQKEQKPAEWSEEDEDMLNSIIATCQLAAQDRDSGPAKHLLEMQERFLKSLRPQPKQEWSEEDKVMLNNIIWSVHMKSIIKPLDEMDDRSRYKKYEDFLKALPERFNLQPHWKPSEEQMRAVFDASERNDKLGFVLRNLYNDLKKL